MLRRHGDPPDGQPPTCVAALNIGRIFNFVPHAIDLLVLSEANFILAEAKGAFALANSNSNHPEPLAYKCDKCDRLGVRFFDQHWCCELCGQAVLDRLMEELVRPIPQPGQGGTK